MRVFITGVGGFLGSNVAKLYLEKGWEVAGCDNFVTGKRENVPEGVRLQDRAVQEITGLVIPDVVVHTAAIARSAWPNNDELWEHNVRSTIAVNKLVTNTAARFVHCSSSVVWKPQSSVYAQTKDVSERLALGNGAIALRFGNIYGPGQNEEGHEPNVIANMRRTVRETGSVVVHGTGRQSRRFVHVQDAANAVYCAAKSGLTSIWMDVATKDEITMQALAERFHVPIEYGPSRNDPHVIRQEIEAAKWLIGWQPTIPLEVGLKEVIGGG
jgi:nucleoside-diphosphate-sugar epimerase